MRHRQHSCAHKGKSAWKARAGSCSTLSMLSLYTEPITLSLSMRCRSKLLAEKRAFELCGEQSQWSLVTIQPPVVQGPPPGRKLFVTFPVNVM